MALSIKPYIENKERIHLIGIGGVSMNSLAELLLSKGVPVSGSDRLRTDVTARLEALGASITYEHKPENVEGASLIVRTAAVHDENPEIVRAHELGIPVMERAEAWGHIMRDYDNVVCLSGTHGKTTSTSMMTMMTIEAQMDPTVMVGSNLPAIGGTLRIGGKGCFVAESCEYTNSFLRFAPTVDGKAVVAVLVSDLGRVNVCIGRCTKGADAAVDVRDGAHRVRVIMVDNDKTVHRGQLCELVERVDDVVDVLEEVEMILLDVQDDRNGRREAQEGIGVLASPAARQRNSSAFRARPQKRV